MIYRHDQIGTIYYGLLVVAVAFCIMWAIDSHGSPAVVATGVFVVLAGISFARLTTEVDTSGLRWWMTFGFPSGRIAIEEIVSAENVSVGIWSGIGIHLTWRGWVWSVATGNGVQIHRCDGMPIVLGTDDPEGLLDAIDRGRSG